MSSLTKHNPTPDDLEEWGLNPEAKVIFYNGSLLITDDSESPSGIGVMVKAGCAALAAVALFSNAPLCAVTCFLYGAYKVSEVFGGVYGGAANISKRIAADLEDEMEREPRVIKTQLGEPSAIDVPATPVVPRRSLGAALVQSQILPKETNDSWAGHRDLVDSTPQGRDVRQAVSRVEERKHRNGVELFDFNMLRDKPDEFTAFAIVADMGGGKTRLIKHLARNVLQGSTTTVMDIYARRGDWTGSKILTNVFDFVEYMEKDLVDIDDLIADFRDGRNAFTPDLFVLEEAADTLTEAKEQAAKKLKLWLSKYLTVTRKIRKRLCMVSTNIADITSAIESAEKRNSVVFIFPGKNGVAKAMGDSYIFKLGTAENAQLRERLNRAMEGLERPALVHLRGQWWVADIPYVNEDGSLPGQESVQPVSASTDRDDDPWQAEEEAPAQPIEDFVGALVNHVSDSGKASSKEICEAFDMSAIEAMQLMQMAAMRSKGAIKYDHTRQELRKSSD